MGNSLVVYNDNSFLYQSHLGFFCLYEEKSNHIQDKNTRKDKKNTLHDFVF